MAGLQDIGGVDWVILAALLMVGGTVVLIIMGAAALVGPRTSLRQRIGAGARAGSAGRPLAGPASLRASQTGGVLGPLTKRFVPSDLADVSKVRLMLVQAGYLERSAIGIFYAARILLAIVLPLAALLLLPAVRPDLDPSLLLFAVAASGLVGLYLPNVWISRRTKSLQIQYRMGFPDALDLMVICVEAGLGLDAAIGRIAQELTGAHRRLGENFTLMTIEMRAGSSRRDALRNLADRLGIDEVRALVTLLNQSEELGTSIADALRVYSDEMRTRRMLRAEIKANSLSVKLSIPLALFIFPVIMTVILLPVLIRIIRSLTNL
ncbi:MAG: type II secretion system F family protein [Dongiaceae bacterium]